MIYSTKLTVPELTIDTLLSKVSEQEIYEHYFGKFKIGRVYNSPFRKDKNPSFSIFMSRKGNLMFKDHGTGVSGGVIKFVSLLTNTANFNDTLSQIMTDLKVTSNKTANSSKITVPKETEIGIVRQPFTEIDKEYWGQFGIQLGTLKLFNVFSIQYYLCNGIVKGIYKDNNPMYAFKVYNRFKIYRPLGDKYIKWRNNLTEKHIQGYKQLPKSGDICIITKSLKDVMCLYEMGIPAISPSSETSFIPDIALKDVLKRFKRVLILFDRDIAGVRQSRLYSLKTGLNAMFVHKKLRAKDISDAIKTNSFEEVKTWITNEIKKLTEHT